MSNRAESVRAIVAHPQLLAEAIATRVALALELRTRPIDRIVSPPAARRSPALRDIDDVGMISEIVTTRLPGLRSRCLVRALVRFRLLRRRGHEAAIVIGLDPSRPDVEGHAWIELNDAPLYESTPPACIPTLRSP